MSVLFEGTDLADLTAAVVTDYDGFVFTAG